MTFEQLSGSDVRLITLNPMQDERGSFARVWCADAFAGAGIDFTPKQANRSVTQMRGTIRGMHWQRAPKADAKVVRCTAGRMHDVVVDLRPRSPCLGSHYAVELTAVRATMLYIPPGFAHGFQSLSEGVEVEYLMGERYDPLLYDGFCYNDPAVSITWPLPVTSISPRDLAWPPLALHAGEPVAAL